METNNTSLKITNLWLIEHQNNSQSTPSFMTRLVLVDKNLDDSSFNPTVMRTLTCLRLVNLSKNRLTKLNWKSNSIEELDLSHNNFDFETLCEIEQNFPKIEKLRVEDNPRLDVLRLVNNHIEKEGFFKNLKSLNGMDMTNFRDRVKNINIEVKFKIYQIYEQLSSQTRQVSYELVLQEFLSTLDSNIYKPGEDTYMRYYAQQHYTNFCKEKEKDVLSKKKSVQKAEPQNNKKSKKLTPHEREAHTHLKTTCCGCYCVCATLDDENPFLTAKSHLKLAVSQSANCWQKTRSYKLLLKKGSRLDSRLATERRRQTKQINSKKSKKRPKKNTKIQLPLRLHQPLKFHQPLKQQSALQQ